ncbi:DNA methyltransferase [Rickettsia montanensis]|uniref:DNA methyltransferase n=1 Tax=Rickettsia montanensis TaxID=33991 RepID=UPI001E31E73D|nr:DNA methyltransferase [Rickettsia montanensis]
MEYRKQRERVYFVCLRKDFSSEYTLKYVKPEESYERIFLNDILAQDVDKNLYINRDDVILDKTPVEKQLKPIRIGQVNKGGQGERIYSPFGHSLYQHNSNFKNWLRRSQVLRYPRWQYLVSNCK